MPLSDVVGDAEIVLELLDERVSDTDAVTERVGAMDRDGEVLPVDVLDVEMDRDGVVLPVDVLDALVVGLPDVDAVDVLDPFGVLLDDTVMIASVAVTRGDREGVFVNLIEAVWISEKVLESVNTIDGVDGSDG